MINSYVQDWLDIIENMSNENTYKLVWGRSILETISEKEINGNLTIHFDELSSKIIKYYWNQIYFFSLTQGPDKKPVIEQIVKEMIEKYQKETGDKIPAWYEKAELYFKKDTKYYKNLLSTVSTVLTQNVSWRFMNINGMTLPIYNLNIKERTISFTKNEAISLYDYRFILSQLLNYRWAQVLEMFNTAPRISSKVKGLSNNKIKRNNLTKFKNILLKEFTGRPIDFYTGKILEENDISVDHVIPWSFMYSDDIWNLVLTSKSKNSSKSNSVPSKETIEKLKKRNEELVTLIDNASMLKELNEAIENNYVDKFYNSIRY